MTDELRAALERVEIDAEMLRQLRHYTECHLLNFPTCGAPTAAEVDAALRRHLDAEAVAWRERYNGGEWRPCSKAYYERWLETKDTTNAGWEVEPLYTTALEQP